MDRPVTVAAPGVAQPPAPDQWATVPNALSALRLLGIPLFLWLVLGPHANLAGLAVLIVAGVTDWLDGWLARRLGQFSRIGALLDPAADRLYIFAVVVALAIRHDVPWWFAVILPLRDVVLWTMVPLLRTRGYFTLPVHLLGKAATFSLLYAFPLLLVGQGDNAWHELARVFGWSFAIWGIALYWWAAVLYIGQVRRLLQTTQPLRARERHA